MDEFLKTQKGFRGSKDDDRTQRAMYAVMIVSDQYAGTEQVNITVMTNTIDMLIAKQLASRISFFMNLLQFAVKLLPEEKEQPEGEQKQDDAPAERTHDTAGQAEHLGGEDAGSMKGPARED